MLDITLICKYLQIGNNKTETGFTRKGNKKMDDLIHEIFLLREQIKQLSDKKRNLEKSLYEQIDFANKNSIQVPSTMYEVQASKKQKYTWKLKHEELISILDKETFEAVARVKTEVDVKNFKTLAFNNETLRELVNIEEQTPYVTIKAVEV